MYNVFKIKNNVNNVNFKDVNVNNVITSPIKPLLRVQVLLSIVLVFVKICH